MTRVTWDQAGDRTYENGVDHGVLYIPDNTGKYVSGYAWNGLTTVTESPSGAESNKQYADNIVYLNLQSAEEFGATVEAFTYPDEFLPCDGVKVVNGVAVGQQPRQSFGLAYRTKVGTDLDPNAGYKLHLAYGCLAAPSEKAYGTVNDSPAPINFSWTVSTTPAEVGTVNGEEFAPSAILTVSSLDHDATTMQVLEDAIYGTAGADPRLPTPAEVIAMFAGAVTSVETVAPTYDAGTDMITIPAVAGVNYMVAGEVVTGTYGPITQDTVVTAEPAAGYTFTNTSDTDWTINFA